MESVDTRCEEEGKGGVGLGWVGMNQEKFILTPRAEGRESGRKFFFREKGERWLLTTTPDV